MKLTFKKIIIDNFLSIGHAEVDLDNRGYTLISGINNNSKDNAKSNGSGKSSIFNALSFALTGETIQGVDKNLRNIFTNSDMVVELDFLVDDNEYKIIRSRDIDDKADLKIFINNVDKSGKGITESEEILKELLPDLTSDLLGNVILIGQSMPHKFSANKPSKRKELLEELTKSDEAVNTLKEKVNRRKDTLLKEKSHIENNISETNGKLTAYEHQLTTAQDEYSNLLKSFDRDTITSELEQFKTKEADLIELTNDLTNRISAKEKTQEKLNESYNQNLTNKETEIEELNKSYNEKILTLKTEQEKLKFSISEKLKEIKEIEEEKDTCPYCHQKLPGNHQHDTSTQVAQLEQFRFDLGNIETDLKYSEEKYNSYKESILNEYKEKLDRTSIDSLSLELKENRTLLKDKESELYSVREKINKLQYQLDTFESEKSRIKNLISVSLQNMDSSKVLLNNLNKSLDNNSDSLKCIKKMETALSRDFRGLLLDNIITYIDKKSKEYCSQIFNTDDLDFKLKGNNIEITYCKKQLDSLSGGEKQRVDLILQFAIREMMSEYLGFSSNILVLDEILDNLDSVSSDAMLNFISHNLNDIESIFIISHHSDSLNIGNDDEITIVKDEKGVSYIL